MRCAPPTELKNRPCSKGIATWTLPGYAAVFFVLRRTPSQLYDGMPRPSKWQRHFFYAWYPLHLLVLTGVYLLFQVK